MALKALMLRKKITDKQKQLETLRSKDADFEKREAELEADIAEAVSDEEKAAVEEAVAAFDGEKAEHEAEKANLENEISGLENELGELEKANNEKPAEEKGEQRKVENNIMNRTKFFNMTVEQRDAFLADAEVKSFLQRVREMKGQTRAVTGGDLAIPEIILGVLRENIENYSKLIKYVNLKRVSGVGRVIVPGTIPEAVWTEMCANLNELSISFNDAEVDGFKVGGYIAICNAVLEDSDLNLAQEIITMLGQAIGFALDKAIVAGSGTKMPLGIWTRLAQTSQPAGYPSTARTWVDLHTSNIKTIDDAVTGTALFAALAMNAGAAKGKYSRGAKFWAMNETTYTYLLAQSVSINAAGAIVAGQTNTMPIIGGNIEILEFIPDNVIVGGYGDLYLLAERAGTQIGQSEHFLWTSDKTVFKGTARYDGLPVIAEGFVVIGINDEVPDVTDIVFAEDSANP